MASNAAVTIADLFEAATAALRVAGVVKPRREANRLFAWLNRTSPGEAYLGRERGVPAEVAAAFRDAVARRAAGEPMAYILGRTGFRNLELKTDRRALIPRPETEGLVDLALQRVRTGRALDLGTGTGCLALALADEGGFDEVVGVDVSPGALELAGENAASTGFPVRFLAGDFGSGLELGRVDLIVSNPPYLTTVEYESLDASVKAWEPALALVSGADGLDSTRRILSAGREWLTPRGWLVMELDSSRSPAVRDLAGRAGWTDVNVWDDLFGRPRYLTARRGVSE